MAVDEQALRKLIREAGKVDPDQFCREAGVEPSALAAMARGVDEDAGPVLGKVLIVFIAGWRQRDRHVNELCHAHGAHNPEGDCFVCDVEEAKRKAVVATSALILRAFRQSAGGIYNIDGLAEWSGLEREQVEEGVDALEEEGKVVAVVAGRDRPHWRLEQRGD